MWLNVTADLFFPQFCKSDLSMYGYLEVFQRVPWTEITRVDCISNTTYGPCKANKVPLDMQKYTDSDHPAHVQKIILGPVVQSVVSLTSSLRVISLTVLADSIHNILIFFAEKM